MKRFLSILAIAGFVLLLAGAFILIDWVQRPLGPALALEVPAKLQGGGAVAARPAAQSKTCGNSGAMQLIVHGRASGIQEGHYGADAVRLVVVNFDAPSAAVLSIPVEVWVDSPVLSDLGIDQTTLSQVYQKAWENAHGQPDDVRTQKATQALAQTIVDNFEFVPDHYVTVEQQAFIDFIDQIGGVQVTLASAVDGTPENFGTFPAGTQILSGLRTLNLSRILHPAGSSGPDYWGQLARQDAILRGMRDTMLDPANITKIPDLVKAIRKAITTDLSVDQVMDLSCMVETVGNEVNLLTVGPDLVTIDEQGHMIPDIAGIKALIGTMGGEN